MKDLFNTDGFKNAADIMDRYSLYLAKILMMRWDPWTKEKYQKWRQQTSQKDQVQLDFYERMKIDEVIR